MAKSKWLESFREGSFRGVPFKTDSHQVQGGRRKQDREFAKRDLGNSEDLGRRLKKFSLELLIIGDDYFPARNALEDALNEEGAGELVHPYRGTIKVQAGTYTLSETVNEGRVARFSVEFTEAGEVKFPDLVADDITSAVNSALSLIDDSKNFFETVFDTVNEAAFVVDAASAVVTDAIDFLEDTIKSVTEPLANLTFAISNLKADVAELITKPGELADRVEGLFATLLAEFENDPDTSNKILGNFNAGLADEFVAVPGTTPSRNTERANQASIINLNKEISLANQTQAAVEIDFPSTSAAIETRNQIVDALDEQIEVIADNPNATDDDLFQSIKDTQTALSNALPVIGTSELITFTPPKTLPALVIAHDLFEDLDKEAEIIDQNDVDHPGFVPGGDEISISAG